MYLKAKHRFGTSTPGAKSTRDELMREIRRENLFKVGATGFEPRSTAPQHQRLES